MITLYSMTPLIEQAMMAKDTVRTNVLRDIKTEFTKYATSPNFVEFKDEDSVRILKGMLSSRQQAYEIYVKAGRNDLAENEAKEMKIIEEFLPKAPTKEDIIEFLDKNDYIKIEKKNMGQVIKEVKKNLLGADGKLVSDIVKSRIS